MEFVYSLWHTHVDENLPGGEDAKLIGIYTSNEKAIEAQSRAEKLKGFRDFPEGFEISIERLDQDRWTSGFATEYY